MLPDGYSSLDEAVTDYLEGIIDPFKSRVAKDKELLKIMDKINAGKASYSDAHSYAIRCGQILKQLFSENFYGEDYQDGIIDYDILKQVLPQAFKANYDAISNACIQVQDKLNEAAGLGITAQVPDYYDDRAIGLAKKVSSDTFDKTKWALGEPVINAAQSVVDDFVKKNAEFQLDAGLFPKIVRTAVGGCCDWCQKLAGTYDYSPDMDTTVFKRHENCRCTTDYIPSAGRRQNVWTKEWSDVSADEMDNVESADNEAETAKRLVFKEAKSIKEAESFAENDLGIATANYKGIDLEVANQMNAAFVDAFNYAPQIRNRMNFVGSAQERNKAWKKDVEDYYLSKGYNQTIAKKWSSRFVGRINSQVMAQAYSGEISGNSADLERICKKYAGITCNSKFGKDAESMVEYIVYDSKSGFHPKGSDTIRSIFDHEVGHQIDYAFDLSGDPEFIEYYKKLSKADISKGLSGYATTNESEFIAEAYSEYKNNPNPRSMAAFVGELIEGKRK